MTAFQKMAPRPGLEPGTNGLTVQVTPGLHRFNSKNSKRFSDVSLLSYPKSEPIPKLPYESLPKLNSNLWLQADL